MRVYVKTSLTGEMEAQAIEKYYSEQNSGYYGRVTRAGTKVTIEREKGFHGRALVFEYDVSADRVAVRGWVTINEDPLGLDRKEFDRRRDIRNSGGLIGEAFESLEVMADLVPNRIKDEPFMYSD